VDRGYVIGKSDKMRKKSRPASLQTAQHLGGNGAAKIKLARFMHSLHGSHERNPLPELF
jgi:hypothetical protein